MSVPNPQEQVKKTIFLIHGRNEEARNALTQFLQSAGLEVLTFAKVHEDIRRGNVHIEDVFAKGMEEAKVILALFTPDEYATLAPAYRSREKRDLAAARWQARPNVIFETGFAFGKYPEQLILVKLGKDVDLFSDVDGIVRIELDGSEDRGKELLKKLDSMGVPVNWRAVGKLKNYDRVMSPVFADPFSRWPWMLALSAAALVGAAVMLLALYPWCHRFLPTMSAPKKINEHSTLLTGPPPNLPSSSPDAAPSQVTTRQTGRSRVPRVLPDERQNRSNPRTDASITSRPNDALVLSGTQSACGLSPDDIGQVVRGFAQSRDLRPIPLVRGDPTPATCRLKVRFPLEGLRGWAMEIMKAINSHVGRDVASVQLYRRQDESDNRIEIHFVAP